MSEAVGRVTKIGIDVGDLDRAAAFWSQVLGLESGERGGPYQTLGNLNASTILFLQLVPEEKRYKNRMHFDISVIDLDEAVRRVIALGGTLIREVGNDNGHLCVMADPDGNEFCLLPPGW